MTTITAGLLAALFLTLLLRAFNRPARRECMYCSAGCNWNGRHWTHDNGLVDGPYEPPLDHPAVGELYHPAIPRDLDWRNA